MRVAWCMCVSVLLGNMCMFGLAHVARLQPYVYNRYADEAMDVLMLEQGGMCVCVIACVCYLRMRI